ncbi:hypothetical protein ABG768_024272 [Culter alburnus]|uniref:small monomeric GTPase n=1 Tax=Culter alburnus TaxID=194366 RepID=A0AAW2AIL1_CULAL
MSGRRSKKNQRLGSSRRGPKGLKNIEQDKDDDDDGLQQIAESGDGQNEFHTTTDYHSAQFNHPPSQQTSVLECPPHASSQKDSLMQTELPERKRKMGSTRKSPGGFKVERNLDEVRSTEELDEYLTQPNTSATKEQHSSLTEDEQSRSSSFPSNLSLQTESSGLVGEPRATFVVVVPENEEKDAIHHQEITSHSYEVVNDMPVDKTVGGSVHFSADTVGESDLLREDSVMFNELKALSHQETPLASTSGQKRRMGSTRRPLGGKNCENVGVQEHSRSMSENERKAEVIDEAKFSTSEEMAQMWDGVARDDPSSHTESSLVSNPSLLAELKEPDVSAGTETMNQSVVFPLVDPEKPLPETSSHHGTPLLNKGLDFKFGSYTEDFDVLNKDLEEAGSHFSDNNQHVLDTREDTNTSHNCRDVNTVEAKEEVLKQKEEPSRNNKTSSLSPRQDAQLEELVLNCEESPSLSQHNNVDCSTAQLKEGGNRGFDVPASNISHAEPTATSSPHEMSDAVKESQEIYMEKKHENNVCKVVSITCDTLTDLECVDEDERGSETDNGFEMIDQSDARDHSVTKIIMEVRDNKEDAGTSTETVWISHQEPCEVSTEKEELHRQQEYSSTISQTQSGPAQDNAGKMLENKEAREDKGDTENTVINDVTSKSEEMLSFEDSATKTGSHAHQQQFMQSPEKEGYDLSESGYEESEKEGIFFSPESENMAFDRSDGRSEETEGIEGIDATVLILDVEKPLTNVNTACNDSKSDLQTENPEQNRVLTEEQNYTSPDSNLEAFQVSDNVSTVIDSSLLLHVAVGSEETDTIVEDSDPVPEDSQDSYKLTIFHSETQGNEGDAEIVPVGGDKDLEIQTQNKAFYSSTSEAVGTEENIHDVSVLVREFDVNGDTVTVESNRTTESDFLQTSADALKSENPENEVLSDIIIVSECSHREEVHAKLSPVIKRKMGSTRRPLRGDTGQRKRREYLDENETFATESMINVEKETFSLEDEPSPNESSLKISKDGAKEQGVEICEKIDVGPVEGSESDLMQSSFSLGSEETDTIVEDSDPVPEDSQDSYKLTIFHSETQGNEGDAERVPAEGDTESRPEIETENKMSDLTSEAERTEENICEATVLVGEVQFIVDTVTVESKMTIESELLQNDTFTDTKLEALKVSENTENVSSVTDTGLVVHDATEASRETDTIPDQHDTNIIPEDSHREEAHSKSSPIVHKRKMGSTRRPLKGNKGKERKYDENETLDSEAMINVEKETFSLEYEPSPDESTLQISNDGAKEQKEICEKNDVGPAEGSESALMQSSFSLDLVSEESTAVTVSHITESQTLTKINEESQENTGDAEKAAVGGDTDSHPEIQTENKMSNLTTSEAERTEENICEATVLVGEVQFIVDTATVESKMTTESELLQNDTFTDAKLKALKVSENTENVSSVTDTGLVVHDATEASRETDTIPDQSDTNIIPEDSHREEAHSKSSPIVHKRKMGSTRRPLKGNKGKERKYDENETLDSEAMINVEKETFSLVYEPSPDESTLQISNDGAKEQKEICEKIDVGPVEGSESDLMQSSFSLDLVSEESTAVTVCHITESQTLTKMNEESQENTGDAERVPAEGDTDSHPEIQTENKMSDLTSEAERTEENICEATVLVGEVQFIVDTVTVESKMTIESELLQNDTFTDAKLEALKVSENTENVSSVTDTGLVVHDATEASRETDTIPDQHDTNIIPEDSHREEAHSKSSPIVHKRKMGSTRRPLKGNKGKERKYDENETLDSEAMINVEKETFSLEYEPSPDESTLQISNDGAKEQKEICEKNDVGPAEGSESALMQSSFSLDLVSEESTAVTVSHITESQTLTKINEESQENTGDAEKAAVGGDTDSHPEIQTENKMSDLTTSEAERTEENICEATVLVGEVQFIVDTVTVESKMTIESELLQNDTFTDTKLEALKVSENTENVSSVTDTGLVVHDATTASRETDTIPDQSDTNIILEDSHREEAHSKSSPIVHKRKMGSTRRPLKGNKGKERKYDENETLDSEAMINVEKETFSLEDQPSPDEITSQRSKDGVKEQKEICEKIDVGPVEGSESDLMQSSFSLDLVSEESTAVTVCHITESQTLTKINEESQENTGDAERVPAEGDTDSHPEIQTENKMSDLTSEAERTEENICEATVLVGEVQFIVDTVTVESKMTIESELLQNDTFTDAKLEALKVSENTENVSSVTDTGLVVHDATEASRETDTIPDQHDTNIIPEDSHREEAHSKSSPIVHKRKMGSTRRPLKGNKGKERKYDENETLDSEAMINVEKETFSLEYEPSPDESTLQISNDGAKEQKEICEKNDVGPAEGSESALMQSSFSLDLVSEESTAVTVSHITESQTLTKINEESQENTGDAEKAAVGGDTDSHPEIQTENKMSDLTTSEAERTEENICEATVLVGEVQFIVDTVTVESKMTIESELLQNDTFTDTKLEALKVSENTENVSSVTDTGLVVHDATTASRETDTIPDQSDTNIILEDSHREEAHSKSSPIVHKRKMGSTRRPLKGNKGKERKYDENETLDSEAMINVEKETFSLEDQPSPDEITSQRSKDGVKEQKEICEKIDVGPVEGSESDLMQSSFSLDLVSEESTAVTVCHITESQTLTKINEESQENTGDAERVPAEGDTDSHPEIQTENKMSDLTSEAERTEENICEATVLVGEVQFIVDTVTVESKMTIESELLQNDTFTDAKLEALKASENTENVSSVTDTGLVVHDATEASRETDTIPDQSDTNIILEDSHREEAHSKSSPIVHKRKMGSTRRPLKGNKGKERKYHDENETLDSEAMINVEKETFGLEDKSTSPSSKDAQKLTDVKLEALKLSENTENVSFVTDTGLLVQDDTTKGYSDMTTESDFHQKASSPDAHVEEFLSENVEKKDLGETDTITEPSDINIIPEDTLREAAHSKSTPVVHKRKMGSTRRPLSGNKGQRKVRVEVSGEEDTETLSEIQDQVNVFDHNVTQEIMKIRDDEDEERMTTKPVQEQRSDVSQTQTGPSQDDTGSHLLEVPERAEDFVSDSLTSHSDLVLSLMEETQIHVSSEDVMSDTFVPSTEVVEMHSVSNRSLQKRKMGSTRKRGKRMVNEEEVEEEKEGEAENTTIDDGTTKSEEKLTLEEAITGSPVHQQVFSSSAGKEGLDIQEVASKSDVQIENSEEIDQNQAAEMASDLPLGDVETYSVPEQSEIISIITEESHRKDVQSNSIPVVQKRKMGSTRKTLRGNKGQRREEESKKMYGESKGMAKEQDTDPHLATSEGENKLDEDVEQNFPVEFSHQAAISNMFSESEDGVKEVSLNIHDPSDVSEEKGIENTENDSNSLNEAIDLYEGTTDKFVLTVSREDVHQSMSADYLDQHVHGASEPGQTETMCHAIPTQELKITQDDVVHENSSQKIPSTHEKKRKMGSTRRKPREMHGKNMGDQDDILDMAMDRETKKAEDDLDDMPLALSISQPKEMSSEAVSTTDLESEMLVGATDLKEGENYQNNSDHSEPTGPETPENTLQICENELVNVDVTKHLQPETVTIEKRRKMGSTRKNLREGRIRGKRDAYEDMETADTHLQISQDSEMSLVGKAVGEQTIQDYSNQSEDSLLSEIERALNKTSQSSSNYELIVNQPNLGDLANIPDLNKLENSEIKSLQLKPSQSSKTHSEPNSPERRRRKMGSTRKNPRQQIKAEREDEDKEDEEIEENLETNKQEIKDLERVEVSGVHNIPENKLNKEYLDVPSAHTSGSQLEESGNPVVQERTSPSTKRKFGSRRTNKGKQGLGRLDASDMRNELEDGDHKPNVSEVKDNLHSDLTVCDPYLGLQPGNQPISQPISEQSNMEARNEEAAPKGTGAGLVSLDQTIKHDRSTGTRQTINLNRNSEVQFNVVMVGNSCVGKTSFVRRFHEGQFTEDFRSTIGVDTCVQTVLLPERTVKLQIWDTAGQERFHSITTQVFHKADGLLLMYEITCSKSFISVRDWISQARERAPDDAIMILLGNKNDSAEREVQIQEGVDLAREYDILFMECSAATGANVSESMRTLAELLVQRKTRKEEHTKLRREPPPKKSGCC